MSRVYRKSDAQVKAEANVAAFRNHLGPFVVAAEQTRMAIVFTDATQATNPIVFANAAFLKLLGFPHDVVLGKGLHSLLHSNAEPEALAELDRALEDYEVREISLRREGGGDLCVSIFASPVVNQAGDLVQHFLSFADLTALKQEQRHLKLMVDELNHRVKNTLATVQAIVRQALRRSRNQGEMIEAVETRLLALSQSHDLLTQKHWTGASLNELVRCILGPFGLDGKKAGRITATGDDIFMSPSSTLTFSLALNELATNAARFGALSNDTGSIAIDWRTETRAAGDRLIFTWAESGGPPVTAPERKGFGSQVIERGLVHELGGSADLQYRAEGLICTIDAPVPSHG